jgi:hypothetical protein
LVLGSTGGPSSLVTSISAAAELLEDQIDATATNRVRWGSRFMLVASMLHLEVLRSGRSTGLVEGKVDALWSRVSAALDSLALHISSSVACNPPDSARE